MPNTLTKNTVTLITLTIFLLFGSVAWAEKGRTNPFELPSGIQYKGRQLPSVNDLDLQAVVEGESQRIATINNRNYLVGDLVKGREIVEIAQNHVVLADGPQFVKLGLNRKPFSIRVTPAASR